MNAEHELILLICKVEEQKSATFKERLGGGGDVEGTQLLLNATMYLWVGAGVFHPPGRISLD